MTRTAITIVVMLGVAGCSPHISPDQAQELCSAENGVLGANRSANDAVGQSVTESQRIIAALKSRKIDVLPEYEESVNPVIRANEQAISDNKDATSAYHKVCDGLAKP